MLKVGFVGAGKMGVGVAANLAQHDNQITVLARAQESLANSLLGPNLRLTSSLSDCLSGMDFIFLCLPSMSSWAEVTSQALTDCTPTAGIIDLTSAAPSQSRLFQSKAKEQGISFVDAPMLKGPAAAARAEIQLLVGGDAADVDRAMPLLEQVSEAQFRTGEPGSGHALKLLNNAVTLTNSAVVYETFALAAKLGVDLRMAHQAMSASAASSKRLNAIAPVLMSGEHLPSFDVSTALKDLELYCEMVRDAGSLSFSAAGARTLYRLGEMFGLSDEPVTRLAEMMFDFSAGHIDGAGMSNSIHNHAKAKQDAL